MLENSTFKNIRNREFIFSEAFEVRNRGISSVDYEFIILLVFQLKIILNAWNIDRKSGVFFLAFRQVCLFYVDFVIYFYRWCEFEFSCIVRL